MIADAALPEEGKIRDADWSMGQTITVPVAGSMTVVSEITTDRAASG